MRHVARAWAHAPCPRCASTTSRAVGAPWAAAGAPVTSVQSCMHELGVRFRLPAPQAPLHSAAARAVPHRQDRIDSSGAWWSGAHPASQQQQQQQEQQQPYVIGSSAGRGDTAPNSPPVSDAAVDQLADLLQSARGALVLTGAGCSTESGVPDYRYTAGTHWLAGSVV